MKKVRYRVYMDYEKEEKWINEMAAQGWHLKKFLLGSFTFTKGAPGGYIYRNECIIGKSLKEKKEYYQFLEDSGITIIHEFGGWVYMKKATAEGPFELYTDTASKIDYFKRMLNIFFFLFFINVWSGILNVSVSVLADRSISEYLNSGLGILNIAVALLVAIPLIKIIQRKRELIRKQQFFE